VIALVGANSWLVERLLPVLRQVDSVFLFGRSPPNYLDRFNEQGMAVTFAETDYHDPTPLVRALSDEKHLTVVFAGVGTKPNLIVNTSQAEVLEATSAHLVFPFCVVGQLLPGMMKHQFGRFIFIGSTHGSRGMAGSAVYSTAKSGQKGLSRSIAVEYGRFHITSNVIDIGFLEGGYSDHLSDKARESILENTPGRRAVEVRDVANAILALIDNDSINGSVVNVDLGA